MPKNLLPVRGKRGKLFGLSSVWLEMWNGGMHAVYDSVSHTEHIVVKNAVR